MGLTPIAPTPDVVVLALIVNGALVGFLILVVGVGDRQPRPGPPAGQGGRAAACPHRRPVQRWSPRRRRSWSRWSASFTLDRGLDNWFSTRTQAIVENSLSIAAGLRRSSRSDQLAHRSRWRSRPSSSRRRALLDGRPDRLPAFLDDARPRSRNLPRRVPGQQRRRARRAGDVADQCGFPAAGSRRDRRSRRQRRSDAVLLAAGHDQHHRRASPSLPAIRTSTSTSPGRSTRRSSATSTMTNDNVAEYRALEADALRHRRSPSASSSSASRVVVLLSAIWLGIGFANRLVAPIRRLIDAAKRGRRTAISTVQVDAAEFGRRRRRARRRPSTR